MSEMRFFEFIDPFFPYYALIGAKNETEAVELYQEAVADLNEENDNTPDEITEEGVRQKMQKLIDEGEATVSEFEADLQSYDPVLLIIDSCLS